MSTSFVEYRGCGFWSWDGYLEHVLALLADRISSCPQAEWLTELRDYWCAQSSGKFRGFINPKLDAFVTNDERREWLLAMLAGIISQPDLTPEARDTARLLEALLRGQLHTDAASPLDYMVTGPQPYEWSLE